METGLSDSKSIEEGSDIYYDHECSVCVKDGRHVEANKGCMECGQNLCPDCLRHHDKFEGMKGHQIIDKAAMIVRGHQVPSSPRLTETCKTHISEVVNMFCRQHDQACCAACIEIDHRLCQGIGYLPHAAKGIRNSSEVDNTKDAIEKVRLELSRMRVIRQGDLLNIDTEKTKILAYIDMFRDSIISHLDDLMKKAKDEVYDTHSDLENKINTNIATLSEAITVLENNLERLDSFKEDNEAMLFLSVKQGKHNKTNGRKLLDEMQETVGREELNFIIDSDITEYILNLKSIGDIDDIESHSDDKPFTSAKLIADYNVMSKGDADTCNIKGVCLLNDGSVIISDFNNKAVKLLNRSYNVIHGCTLSSCPHDLCITCQTEVAVTLPKKKEIQFVSVKNKKLACTRSIRVDVTCHDVAFNNGELFVTSGGYAGQPAQVTVYSLSGEHLRSFMNNQSGRIIFSDPCNITVNKDGNRVHFADGEKGVVTTDRWGNYHWTFSDRQMESAHGICTGNRDVLLICGVCSDNLIQVDSQGRNIGELLSQRDGLKKPQALCYDSNNHRIIVAMHQTDFIKVFKLRQ